MTDSTDLVGRLRFRSGHYLADWVDEITNEAAAEIERLTRERDRWHDAAMKAGVVVCTNGGLIYTMNDRAKSAESKLREIEAETREACAKIAESPVGLARLCPYGGDKPGDSTWDHTDEDVCPVCKVKCKDSLAKCTDNVGGRIAAAIRSHASQGEKK